MLKGKYYFFVTYILIEKITKTHIFHYFPYHLDISPYYNHIFYIAKATLTMKRFRLLIVHSQYIRYI